MSNFRSFVSALRKLRFTSPLKRLKSRGIFMGLTTAIGAGIAVCTGIGAGIGIGIAVRGLMEAISRQPEATNKMTPMFFIGVALAEATAIYGFVIAVMIITSQG